MTKKRLWSLALEIGIRRDGDPVVECLQAMFGDATSPSVSPSKEHQEIGECL